MDKVHEFLLRLTSNDNDTRKAAEAALQGVEQNPSFITGLFQIICSPALARPASAGPDYDESMVRTMAVLVFTKIVRKHWIAGPGEPRLFSDDIKSKIRAGILQAMFNSGSSKARTTLAVVVGHIAQFDWPERWPALFPSLFQAVSGAALQADRASKPYQMALSGLRCLSVIAEDICDETLFKLMPLTMPRLLTMVQAPSIAISVKKDVLRISTSFLKGLSVLRHHKQQVLTTLGASALPGWVNLSFQVLRGPLSPKLHGLKLLVLRFHDTLLSGYRKSLSSGNVKDIIASQIFNLRLYAALQTKSLVEHDIDPPTDDDGEKFEVESVTMATFGCLRRIAQCKTHRTLLKTAVGPSGLQNLIEIILQYAQVSAHQVQRWEDDVNAFNADEDGAGELTEMGGGDECTSAEVRSVAMDLLCAVLEQFREKVPVRNVRSGTWREGSVAVATTVGKFLQHATTWQMEEIAVKVCSLLSDTLESQQNQCAQSPPSSSPSRQPGTFASPLSVGNLFRCAMQRISAFFAAKSSPSPQGSTRERTQSPFLLARYFWFCSDLTDCMSFDLREKFVKPAEMAMHPSLPLCLRLCAVRLIYALARRVVRSQRAAAKAARQHQEAPTSIDTNPTLRQRLGFLLHAVSNAMQSAGDDNLHICVETVGILLQVEATTVGATAAAAKGLIPPLLKLWTANTNHPMNGTCIMDVFRQFSKVPDCLPTLHRALTPVIGNVIGSPRGGENAYNSSVVEGCTDLLHVLLCAQGSLQTAVAASPSKQGNAMASGSLEVLLKALDPVLRLAAQSDDQTILQSTWNVLRAYMRLAPARIAGWKSGDQYDAPTALTKVCARFLAVESANSPVDAGSAGPAMFQGVWNDAALGQVGHGIGGLCARVISLPSTEGHSTRVATLMRMLVERLMVTQLVTLKAELLRPFATLLISQKIQPAELVRFLSSCRFLQPPKRATRRTRVSQASGAFGASSQPTATHPSQGTVVGAFLQAWVDAMQDSYFSQYVLKLLLAGLSVLWSFDAIANDVYVSVEREGTAQLVPFRVAAFFVTLRKVVAQAEDDAEDEESGEDYYETESDDEDGEGERFLLSDMMAMGGMGALYGEDDGDDDDDDDDDMATGGEDAHDNMADDVIGRRFDDAISVITPKIRAAMQHAQMRNAVALLQPQQQKVLQAHLSQLPQRSP